MSHLETGQLPHGFSFAEDGTVIHHKDSIVIATPSSGSGGGYGWSELFFSLGCDWADARVRVAAWDDTGTWTVKTLDVLANGPRVGFTLPAETQKVSVGRVKKTAGDLGDDVPIGWLIESQA